MIMLLIDWLIWFDWLAEIEIFTFAAECANEIILKSDKYLMKFWHLVEQRLAFLTNTVHSQEQI